MASSRNIPLIGLVYPVNHRPGRPGSCVAPWVRGSPRSSSTPRCPRKGSSPWRYPVARRMTSGVSRVPSPEVGEVGDLDLRLVGGHPVDEARREVADRDAVGLGGDAQTRAPEDVRRGAHGDADLRGPVVGEVGGDLGAGVADADDEHRATGEGGAVAVGAGVDHLAGEGLETRPGGLGRRVVVASGDDEVVALVDLTGRGADPPAAVRPLRPADLVHPGDLDAGSHVEPVVAGIGLEVLDDVVPGFPGETHGVGEFARGSAEGWGSLPGETRVSGGGRCGRRSLRAAPRPGRRPRWTGRPGR